MIKTTAASIAFAIAAPAYAGDFDFDYKRHELETAVAAEAMFKRLESRIESYCTSPGRRPLTQIAVEKSCMDDLLSEVVEQIDDPRLYRVYARKTGATDYAGSAKNG